MKLTWLTDIHLNFIDEIARQQFYQEIINTQCDGVLITGDIAEAPSVVDILNEMAAYIKKPIYFVLGNHDYYKGRVNEVRAATKMLSDEHEQLFWLPASGMQKLNKDTFLIGQDGWADGRLGDYRNSSVVLSDSRMIVDLFQENIFGKYRLLEKMQQLADEDAMKLQNDLEKAIKKNPKKIIILTHVPPFKEACFHMGEMTNDDFLPYFSSKVMGDVLIKIAQENSKIEFLVLCGHTHSNAEYQPLHNLIIYAGSAEYRKPTIQRVICV